ncbi:phage portal protein [Verrucomicrobiota bacterium sgz303538]
MKVFATLRAAAAGAFLGFRGSVFGSYSDATDRFSPDRGTIYYYAPSDSRQYVSNYTRREVSRRVDWLFQNFGVLKEGARGIARHSVGTGISLQINSDDEEWNELAETDVETFFMSADRCDRSGRRNFYEIQNHAVFSRVKVGEFLASFAENPRWNGAPCLQLWDADELETPTDKAEDPYTIDGVQMDEDHCPTFYWVRSVGGSYKAIPAAEMIHWYHADATNQVRGVSEFAQAVASFQDVREAVNITTKTAKQASAFGLHIKRQVRQGGQGGISKIESEAARLGGAKAGAAGLAADENRPAYEKVAGGGGIIYTDQDGDAKFITPQSPTPLLEPFVTKVLMRNGFASIGMSAEFFWSLSDLNGTSVRLVNQKAEATFDWFADGVIGRVCTPFAVRYLLHRIETKALRPCSDPDWITKLHWQRPARLSVDRGDAAIELEQMANGVETLANINDRRGRGWRPQTRQWFKEWAYAAKCAKASGVEWALKFWRASKPGSAMPNAEDAPAGDAKETNAAETDTGKKAA